MSIRNSTCVLKKTNKYNFTVITTSQIEEKGNIAALESERTFLPPDTHTYRHTHTTHLIYVNKSILVIYTSNILFAIKMF